MPCRRRPLPTPPGGDETLLLVEDDSAVRHFLVRTFERQGATRGILG